MNDAQQLAAIRAYAQTIINLVDGSGEPTTQVPVPPAGNPVPPQPIPTSGEYPSGSALEYTLATLTREFNSNNAAQNGMVGNPEADLLAMVGSQDEVSRWKAKVDGANPLLAAAVWLRHGATLEQVLAQNFKSPPEIMDLVHVMQHYALLPA